MPERILEAAEKVVAEARQLHDDMLAFRADQAKVNSRHRVAIWGVALALLLTVLVGVGVYVNQQADRDREREQAVQACEDRNESRRAILIADKRRGDDLIATLEPFVSSPGGQRLLDELAVSNERTQAALAEALPIVDCEVDS